MYTKKNIETIVEELKKLLEKHNCQDDVCIYYCGQRDKNISRVYDKVRNEYTEANKWSYDCMCHPTQYCEYAPSKNIISFSSEGILSDLMYSGAPKWLDKFAGKYSLYIECATSWFFYFAPQGDWDEWETDNTKIENQEPIYLYHDNDYNGLPELRIIANFWERLCYKSEDRGGCALGYGMFFIYQGTKYKMIPRSNKQGEWSWAQWVDIIKSCLADIGRTNIYWDCGRLD